MAGLRLGNERNTVVTIGSGSRKQHLLPLPTIEGHTMTKKLSSGPPKNYKSNQAQPHDGNLVQEASKEGQHHDPLPLAVTKITPALNIGTLKAAPGNRNDLRKTEIGIARGVSTRAMDTMENRSTTAALLMTSLMRDLSSDSAQDQRHFSRKIEEFTKRYSVEYGGRAAGVPLLTSIRESYNVDSSILVPRGTSTNAAIHVLRDKVRALKEQKDYMECENTELLEDMNNVIDENFELVEQVENLQEYINVVERNVETLEEERNYLLEEVESAERHWKRSQHEKEVLEQHVKALTQLLIEHGVLPAPPSAEEEEAVFTNPEVETAAVTVKKSTAKKFYSKTKKVMKKGGIKSGKHSNNTNDAGSDEFGDGGRTDMNHTSSKHHQNHLNIVNRLSSPFVTGTDKSPPASKNEAAAASGSSSSSPRFRWTLTQHKKEHKGRTKEQIHESTKSNDSNRSEERKLTNDNTNQMDFDSQGQNSERYLFHDDDVVACEQDVESTNIQHHRRQEMPIPQTQTKLKGKSQYYHHGLVGNDPVPPPPSASATANQWTSPSTCATILEISNDDNEEDSLSSALTPTNIKPTPQSFEMKGVQSVPHLAERAAANPDDEYF